jgi:hypothetical protein
MIINNPVVVPTHAPPNRLPVGDRPGGGSTAMVTDLPRALHDPEHTSAGRRSEAEDHLERRRSGRDDAELSARVRLDVAREQAREKADDGGQARRRGDGRSPEAGDFISAAEIRQFRDRLEARLAGSDPGTITLRSIDVLG